MNSIFAKLKTSATLWSVIAGVVVGVATLQGADGNNIEVIAGAVITIVPLTTYIISKFRLRIAAADANADGKISAAELVAAIVAVAGDVKEPVEKIKDAVETATASVSKSGTAADTGEATANEGQ